MLTERTIRSKKPDRRTRIYWDTNLKGLGFRITPAGSRAFVLRYIDAKGKQRLATLARVGEVSLREIRELAGRELLKIRMGEAGPLSRRQKRRDAVTVAQGIGTFFEEFCPNRIQNGKMTARTVHDYEKMAARYLIPAIGKLDVDEIQRSHIEAMVRPLRPVLRNRVLALASRIFRYFEDQGLRTQYSNPCRGVERSREEPRDRTLTRAEISALGKALAKANVDPIKRAVIQVAMLTGLRISEVISLRWEWGEFRVPQRAAAVHQDRPQDSPIEHRRSRHPEKAHESRRTRVLRRPGAAGHLHDGAPGFPEGCESRRPARCAAARPSAHVHDACCRVRRVSVHATRPAGPQDGHDGRPLCAPHEPSGGAGYRAGVRRPGEGTGCLIAPLACNPAAGSTH